MLESSAERTIDQSLGVALVEAAMPDDLQERVAKILASAKKVESKPDSKDPSVAIYGSCVYVAGNLNVESDRTLPPPAVSEKRDLLLILKGLIITFCAISMAHPSLAVKFSMMTVAVAVAWITLWLGWKEHRRNQRRIQREMMRKPAARRSS